MENLSDLIEELQKLRLSITKLTISMENSSPSPQKIPLTPLMERSSPLLTPPSVKVGECITVKVLEKGKTPSQAISFFEGAKVIINGGGEFVGKEIDVEVIKVHPTVIGFLIFCKL